LDSSLSSCGLAEAEAAETTTSGNLSAGRQHDREPAQVKHFKTAYVTLLMSWMPVQSNSDSSVEGND
jgi:hypothetical protein